MKNKLLFLYFLLNSLLSLSQEAITIPLNYSTEGYTEEADTSLIPIINPPYDNSLVPTVNAENECK